MRPIAPEEGPRPQYRSLDTLAQLRELRAALVVEIDAFAPSRRTELGYADRRASLARIERRIANLARATGPR